MQSFLQFLQSEGIFIRFSDGKIGTVQRSTTITNKKNQKYLTSTMFRKSEDFLEKIYMRYNEKLSLTGPKKCKTSVLFTIEDVY